MSTSARPALIKYAHTLASMDGIDEVRVAPQLGLISFDCSGRHMLLDLHPEVASFIDSDCYL